MHSLLLFLHSWCFTFQAVVAALFMNIYIVGLNQLSDIDIDKVGVVNLLVQLQWFGKWELKIQWPFGILRGHSFRKVRLVEFQDMLLYLELSSYPLIGYFKCPFLHTQMCMCIHAEREAPYHLPSCFQFIKHPLGFSGLILEVKTKKIIYMEHMWIV